MKMSLTQHMRLEQQMKLAPRMIQSMEILQLPLLALEEKIEAELNSNPVLELDEDRSEEDAAEPAAESDESAESLEQKELVVNDDDRNNLEDFQRLDSLGDDYSDYINSTAPYRRQRGSGDPDKKLEALRNTAALEQSLNDYLIEQWRLVETERLVKEAGELIIDYIDEKGYITIRIEQLHNKDKHDFGIEHLNQALVLVQKLEPPGVGARNLAECLLIQMAQFPDDMSFEIRLVENYWTELLENKLPQIAHKMQCSVQQINDAITHMSKLDTSPGLQVGRNDNHPITADILVEPDQNQTGYLVLLTDTRTPSLRVNNFYSGMAKDKTIDRKTRDFLQQNIRSAQWFMDAIAQRKNTLLKVARSIIKHQVEFFDKGRLYLKPLPMAKVAEEVGVHLATVSRAVAGKYIQCPQGILPLRGFFSGGMQATDGTQKSYDAIREELKQLVEHEDKSKPLNDDDIRKKLLDAGLGKIARRTIAKYRKLMNIPTARFRKKY